MIQDTENSLHLNSLHELAKPMSKNHCEEISDFCENWSTNNLYYDQGINSSF